MRKMAVVFVLFSAFLVFPALAVAQGRSQVYQLEEFKGYTPDTGESVCGSYFITSTSYSDDNEERLLVLAKVNEDATVLFRLQFNQVRIRKDEKAKTPLIERKDNSLTYTIFISDIVYKQSPCLSKIVSEGRTVS